jgi:hypothetical protein
MKYVGWGILALVGLIALSFVFTLAGFAQFAFFAPKVMKVQNQVFQQSQQYNEGMVRDLENIQRQYLAATPEQKQALKALAQHRFEVYPFDQLPPDLQNFYRSLQ